jgi:hypothetical protein
MFRPNSLDFFDKFSRVSAGNTAYTGDDRSSIYSQPESAKSKSEVVSTHPKSQMRADVATTSQIGPYLEGSKQSFHQTIGPLSTCTCSSQTSGTFSNATSRWKASVRRGKLSKEDRQAEDLQAEIDKHSEIYAMAMPRALGFFNDMVGKAYSHPSIGNDDQRDQIKGFLIEVLRSGVPITTSEIAQYGDEIDEACTPGRAPSDTNQCFFRLCHIWFGDFTSKIPGKQSQRLSTKVLSIWVPHDPTKTIISHRRKAELEQEKADLARLWKFTHTQYR